MKKILIHTDVVRSHLRGTMSPSALRVAAGRFFCYTSVCTALELFAEADSPRERRAVMDALGVLKVLGINARNAPRYAAVLRRMTRPDPLRAMTAGLCLDAGLPLLTDSGEEFRGIAGLRCISTKTLTEEARPRKAAGSTRT